MSKHLKCLSENVTYYYVTKYAEKQRVHVAEAWMPGIGKRQMKNTAQKSEQKRAKPVQRSKQETPNGVKKKDGADGVKTNQKTT